MKSHAASCALTHFLLFGSFSSMACGPSGSSCNLAGTQLPLSEGNAIGPAEGYRQHPKSAGGNELSYSRVLVWQLSHNPPQPPRG